MVKVLHPIKTPGVLVQKKLGNPDTTINFGQSFGHAYFGEAIYGNDDGYIAGIYQKRKCLEGVISIRMKFYSPTNPQTIPQQANRSVFSSAVAGWQGLTSEQKQVYNTNAKGKNLSGYNLYIREFMLS